MPPNTVTLLQDLVQSWTAPVWFSRGLAEPPANVNDSGSAGFVCAGSHRFIVTAHHVLEGFRISKRLHPETVFAVNIGDSNTVAIDEPQVIAESRPLDFATIAFPHLDHHRGRTNKDYFPLERCPVRRAHVGEPATIVGFPGRGRHAFETFGLFEPHAIGMLVTGVSDRRITLADEHGTLRVERNGRQVEEGIEAGGFSGSPVFGMTLAGELYLMGVVSDGSARLGCVGMPGQLFLGSAEYLLPDGTLDILRMPFDVN
jgi:hypothetical protein